MDLLDKIIAYEQGELGSDATIDLFSELVISGQAWSLQGHYGRTASQLVTEGFLAETGEVLRYFDSEVA